MGKKLQLLRSLETTQKFHGPHLVQHDSVLATGDRHIRFINRHCRPCLDVHFLTFAFLDTQPRKLYDQIRPTACKFTHLANVADIVILVNAFRFIDPEERLGSKYFSALFSETIV